MVIRRWHCWSGAIGLGLVFVALFLPGPPPKTDASAKALTANLVEHRAALVSGVLIAGLGVIALLWFFAVLADLLRSSSTTPVYGYAALTGGLTGLLLIFVGMLLFSGTALRAAGMGDQAVVRAAVDTGNMLIETGKYGFAVLIGATCASAARGTLLSRRMIRAGAVSALVLVLSTIPPFLSDHGIGQFGGGIDVIGGLPGFAWIGVLSAQLARRPEPTPS